MSAATSLPGVFGSIAPLLHHHGYLAVAGVVFLENVGLPIPGEAAVVTGVIIAAAGQLDITAVAIVACAAAVIGDVLGYVIGRRAGRPLILRVGRRIGVTDGRLDQLEGFYTRRGPAVIVVARFLPLLRRFNALAAGVSKMRWQPFVAFNLLGAAIWTALWVLIGDQASNHLGTINALLTTNLPYAIAVVCCAIVATALVRHLRRLRPAPSAVPDREATP
ncbi:MAG TPA: DedA family protein [Mycobacteriales bacterium]|jgi:membrane protein DedA with SNARE-associated domain|nr:DedA family protein [Mycobacteriales bacterium]